MLWKEVEHIPPEQNFKVGFEYSGIDRRFGGSKSQCTPFFGREVDIEVLFPLYHIWQLKVIAKEGIVYCRDPSSFPWVKKALSFE